MIWNMTLSFGKVTPQSILANMITSGVGDGGGRLTNDQIFEMIEILDANTETNRNKLNEVIEHINAHHEVFFTKRAIVEEDMTIPVWS